MMAKTRRFKTAAVLLCLLCIAQIFAFTQVGIALDDVSLVFSEDFERGTYQGTTFDSALADIPYTLEYSDDLKINGKFSAVSPENAAGYLSFMASDPRKLVLGAHRKYSVVFKVKILESFASGGMFYIEARADNNNFRYQRFDQNGNKGECGAVGADDGSYKDWHIYDSSETYVEYADDYMIIKYTFTTSASGYGLMFCLNAENGKGRIAVDDVRIYNGSKVAKEAKAVKEIYTPPQTESYDDKDVLYTDYGDTADRIAALRAAGKRDEAMALVLQSEHAPSYHYFPAEGGYLNDINGFFKYRELYHVFYQYSYDVGGNAVKEWAHATSPDLINWTHHNIALTYDMHYDADGVWSGNAFFDKDGLPVIVYYANGKGICFARPKDLSDPYLTEWVKDENNPAIAMPREGAEYKIYDASNVWIADGHYYLLSGNKNPVSNTPMSYLFRSDNLTDWTFVGEFITPDNNLKPEDDMACPNLADLGGGIYLFTFSSHYSGVHYYTGKFVNERFEILQYGKFNNYGGNEMGSSVFAENGKALYLCWLTELRTGASLQASGWNGAVTLPREITADEEGNLHIIPLPTLEKLRGDKKDFGNMLVADGQRKTLDVHSQTYEIDTTVNICTAVRVGLEVAVGGGEKTIVYYDLSDGTVKIDYSQSSLTPYAYNKYILDFMRYERLCVQSSRKIAIPDKKLHLRIFMDNSVLEVYVNDVLSMSRRIYPGAYSDGVKVFAEGGFAHFETFDFYPLKSATHTVGGSI